MLLLIWKQNLVFLCFPTAFSQFMHEMDIQVFVAIFQRNGISVFSICYPTKLLMVCWSQHNLTSFKLARSFEINQNVSNSIFIYSRLQGINTRKNYKLNNLGKTITLIQTEVQHFREKDKNHSQRHKVKLKIKFLQFFP